MKVIFFAHHEDAMPIELEVDSIYEITVLYPEAEICLIDGKPQYYKDPC